MFRHAGDHYERLELGCRKKTTKDGRRMGRGQLEREEDGWMDEGKGRGVKRRSKRQRQDVRGGERKFYSYFLNINLTFMHDFGQKRPPLQDVRF